MILISDTPRSSGPTHRRRRLAAPLLVAGMLLAGCGVPFLDEGQDISADVDVQGVEPGEPVSNQAIEGGAVDQGSNSTTDVTTDIPPADEPPADEPLPAEIDERFDGRSVRYLGIEIGLGDLIVTSQTAEEYLRSEPAADAERRLLVEVTVTNDSNGTAAVPRSVFGLRLASGERIAADEMSEPDGDRVETVRPEAQSTERVVLTFADVDLAGASFEISDAGAIPVRIPLDLAIPVAEPYSLDLPGQPPVADLASPSDWTGCEYAWTGEVVDARIVLEGVDGERMQRAVEGSRWVAVDLLVTNDTTESEDFYPCNGFGMPMADVSPRLRIDGVATTETNRVRVAERIEMGATAVVQYWYRIDRDTELIELTDTGGTRIAAWELDLPPVDGEG